MEKIILYICKNFVVFSYDSIVKQLKDYTCLHDFLESKNNYSSRNPKGDKAGSHDS